MVLYLGAKEHPVGNSILRTHFRVRSELRHWRSISCEKDIVSKDMLTYIKTPVMVYGGLVQWEEQRFWN